MEILYIRSTCTPACDFHLQVLLPEISLASTSAGDVCHVEILDFFCGGDADEGVAPTLPFHSLLEKGFFMQGKQNTIHRLSC